MIFISEKSEDLPAQTFLPGGRSVVMNLGLEIQDDPFSVQTQEDGRQSLKDGLHLPIGPQEFLGAQIERPLQHQPVAVALMISLIDGGDEVFQLSRSDPRVSEMFSEWTL